MKILLEMRPALDGHAGIPQATRLLFRGLCGLEGITAEGLLQSSSRVVAKGLPDKSGAWSDDRRINRLSRVVVSLDHRGERSLFERAAHGLRLALAPARLTGRSLLGLPQGLTRFAPRHFEDFVWRALFEKTLPPDDFSAVTQAGYRVARMPWTAAHASALATRKFGHALYPRLDTRGYDVMVAETPYPGRMTAPTKLVVRYHDAIPLLMPHTISEKAWHQAAHYNALKRNVQDGAWFACVSEATRRDLLAVFPQAEARAVTIPNMVSHAYYAEDSSPLRVPEILRTRANLEVAKAAPAAGDAPGVVDYLLMVSTIEPRKNHLSLLAAWEQLRSQSFPRLQLVLVGSLGWDHRAIVKKLRPWLARGGLHVLEDVPAAELRLLYRHALATVCPSYGEGFDFSGVEAMRCGGVVAASDIAVHREVYGEAARYFSAYSPQDLAACVAGLIAPDAHAERQVLRGAAERETARYLPQRVLPQWRDFLNGLAASPG